MVADGEAVTKVERGVGRFGVAGAEVVLQEGMEVVLEDAGTRTVPGTKPQLVLFAVARAVASGSSGSMKPVTLWASNRLLPDRCRG